MNNILWNTYSIFIINFIIIKPPYETQGWKCKNLDTTLHDEGFLMFLNFTGSLSRGYYDGYHGESGRHLDIMYNDTLVLGSTVSKSITTYLGGPITQPSAMIPLRNKASVECEGYSGQLRRRNYDTCNETECLFDIVNDPCETKNIARDYPKVLRKLLHP